MLPEPPESQTMRRSPNLVESVRICNVSACFQLEERQSHGEFSVQIFGFTVRRCKGGCRFTHFCSLGAEDAELSEVVSGRPRKGDPSEPYLWLS